MRSSPRVALAQDVKILDYCLHVPELAFLMQKQRMKTTPEVSPTETSQEQFPLLLVSL